MSEGNGHDPLTAKAVELLTAVLLACEEIAAAAGLHLVVIAAAEVGDGRLEVGSSIPEDRLLASRLLKHGQLEIAALVGVVSES